MPRKKFGKKSSSSLNDVNGVKHAENGKTENGKTENGITENEKSKTKSCQSIDSKSSHGSTVSLKKRLSLKKKNFSPFKRNKSPDENGGGDDSRKNGDVVRRTNSLNNIGQDGGRSKIPILRPKKNHQNEANKQNGKHELCPTVNKNGNCESRSLVLNPGMDSWRMAGLMETVSNTNLMLNSSNSLSDKNTTNGFGKKSLETVTSDEILHQSSNAVVVTLNTSEDTAADIISNDPGHHTETVSTVVTKTDNIGVPLESHNNNSNIAVALIVTPSVNDEPIDLEESAIPIPNTEVECCRENDVDSTQELDMTNHQAYVTPEFVSVTPTVLEDIYDVDVYELDNEQFCSVRKLEDFISEHHIELPKEVCCDDWLVLDIAAC